MCMSLKRSFPLKVVDRYSVRTSYIFNKCNNDINSIVFSTETDFLSPSDVLAISSQIKELVSNVVVLRGKTRELVSRDRGSTHFDRQSLKKRKQRPRQLADDTIQSPQVIKMVFALLRYYRVQERLGYDISRFYLITWQEAKGAKRGKTKRNERQRMSWITWLVNLFLSLIASSVGCSLPGMSAFDANKRNSSLQLSLRHKQRPYGRRILGNTANLPTFLTHLISRHDTSNYLWNQF